MVKKKTWHGRFYHSKSGTSLLSFVRRIELCSHINTPSADTGQLGCTSDPSPCLSFWRVYS